MKTLKAVDTPNDRGGSVTLTWTGYTTIDPNMVKFRIYRDTVSFTDVSAMTPIATVEDKTARSYVDKTTTDGVNYWYAVTGVDAVDNENKQVIPAGPVQSIDKALANAHTKHRGDVIEKDWYKGVASPIRFDRTKASLRRVPPKYSEHSDAVLAEFGYSPKEIADLRTSGIVIGPERKR